jgi:eight-cysteine-cluster-containing protein
MRKLAIMIAVLIIASGCASEAPDLECAADEDCMRGGCNGESCQANLDESPSLSVCQWKDEYDCLEIISCGCVEGKCKWETTDEYWGCVEDKKKGE